jgi:hypothetical protein
MSKDWTLIIQLDYNQFSSYLFAVILKFNGRDGARAVKKGFKLIHALQ